MGVGTDSPIQTTTTRIQTSSSHLTPLLYSRDAQSSSQIQPSSVAQMGKQLSPMPEKGEDQKTQ